MHQKIKIKTDNGTIVEAIAPVIISASRSTDIPAFYASWILSRIKSGYCIWQNPFNKKPIYVSFAKTKIIVFWTKNAKPLIPHLRELDKMGISYYFQYTVNDYDKEKFEPNLPKVEDRIKTFKQLSEIIGKEKIIWRFDPLMLTTDIGVTELLDKVESIGSQLKNHTQKLVFSFADISKYKKVANNLKRNKIKHIDFTYNTMCAFAEGLHNLNKNWNLQLATCSEDINLEQFDIKHNSCIDGAIIRHMFANNKYLAQYLSYGKTPMTKPLFTEQTSNVTTDLKDKGQRKQCGCIISKDIGMYDTCPHLCTYCYANSSAWLVNKNNKSHSCTNESIASLFKNK